VKTDATIAKLLLDTGVATFRPDEPFRFNSGILSPIYMDNRVLISHPAERKQISKALEDLARANYHHFDTLAGTATAGIPWAAWIASHTNLPMVYVRDRAKRHGQKNQIEGTLAPGAATIVIEDLVSTGNSCLNAAHAIQRAGGQPLAVVAIFTYQMEVSRDAFAEAGIPLHTLTNFRTLTDMAVKQGIVGAESQERVLDWAADPAGWGKRAGFEK
jgi:orotate phosphoribosyltransferase